MRRTLLVAPARVGGIMSYWIYQHLGNLSPRELDEDEIYAAGPRQRSTPTEVLREWAAEIDSTGSGSRWSFCRDLGGTRAIFIDSRAGRVLKEGERSIVDEEEWEWIVEQAERRLRPPADRDHGALPALARLPPPRGLERAGLRRRLGRAGARGAARSCAARVDFDHWASFGKSFRAAARPARRGRLRASAASRRPRSSSSPATSTTPTWPRSPSGRRPGSQSAVYQAVCSPYRNPLDAQRAAGDQGRLHAAPSSPRCAALAGAAGAPDPGIRWRLAEGPYFDNQVATLRLDGREARMRLDKTVPRRGGGAPPGLRLRAPHRLSIRSKRHPQSRLTVPLIRKFGGR